MSRELKALEVCEEQLHNLECSYIELKYQLKAEQEKNKRLVEALESIDVYVGNALACDLKHEGWLKAIREEFLDVMEVIDADM